MNVQGTDGGVIGEFLAVGGSEILQGFRFSEPGGLRNPERVTGGELQLVTSMPFYAGYASPGTVITISIIGPDGQTLFGGIQTVIADGAGSWTSSFTGLGLGSGPYYIQVEQRLPTWDMNTPSAFTTFFSPTLTNSYTESEVLTVESVMMRRLSGEALREIIDLNHNPQGTNVDWRTGN